MLNLHLSRLSGNVVDLITSYFDTDTIDLEDIIFRYMNLSKPSKTTIEAIGKTVYFKEEYHGNIFYCFENILSPETGWELMTTFR